MVGCQTLQGIIFLSENCVYIVEITREGVAQDSRNLLVSDRHQRPPAAETWPSSLGMRRARKL